MPLQTPILDDRTFQQLVDEAKARIPRYTPEWTNFNASDPGFTLVQLHAWLTETLLYRLNKLPDLTYIKFLELLNVRPHPAVAAKAQLSFKLKKLSGVNDPLVVLIPKNTQVGVDDPDLEEELIFETDRTLTALNGALAAIIAPANTVTTTHELLTEYDAKTAETKLKGAFYPFGKDPKGGETCLLGIVLRPHRQNGKDYSLDRFPEGELDLTALIPQVFEEDAEGDVITGPAGINGLFPWQMKAQSQGIAWEAYNGIDHAVDFEKDEAWLTLNVFDETAALARSGHVYLNVPGARPAVAFSALSRAFWETVGLKKPPSSRSELITDITHQEFAPSDLDEDAWKAMGLTGSTLSELMTLIGDPDTPLSTITTKLATLPLDPNKVAEKVWTGLDYAGYKAQPIPYKVTWFRARLTGKPEKPPVVSHFLLNTVAATAAVTRVEEIVGNSDGRPNQTHTLSRTPVLTDQTTGQPELTLEIVIQNRPETWTVVSDFYGAGPADAVFLLDSETGTLTFGDGVHGRIPVAGAQIIAREYRYGGGDVGNAGAATITALKSALPDVDSVTNVRAAAGGADAETLDEVKLRAPHDLRTRDRAVTADDFTELALRTPGVRIQRAFALAETSTDLTVEPPAFETGQPGAVTVVILPENDEDTPQPSEDQLRLVCDHLNAHRLITTELYVVGPRYLELKTFDVEVTASRDADLKALHEAIAARLITYFHPLRGGEDGRGWPFGHDIFFGNVYRQILGIPGVLRVLCLEMTPAQGDEKCDDVIAVPDGALVYVPQTAINVKVSYDPHG